MRIQDCSNVTAMEKMVSDYVHQQYRSHYRSQLVQKEIADRETLQQELVQEMVQTNDICQYVNFFAKGLVRGNTSVSIPDQFSSGFVVLRDCLFDPNVNVNLREQKLKLFVMGTTDRGTLVWNKGNVLRMAPAQLESLFANVGLSSVWESIYGAYKSKNVYLYRGSSNRHEHNNNKPSFFAMGYKTVGAYFDAISQRERDEYAKLHSHCCGLWNGVLVKPA